MAPTPRHDPELVELFSSPTQAIQRVADDAVARGTLTQPQAAELLTLFGTPPGPEGSGLSGEGYEQFVCTTLQLIAACLLEEPAPQKPLINALLEESLSRECAARDGKNWALTREICDSARKGVDRRFTFGQIKEAPLDPGAPSVFGGAWQADCDGTERRVTFVLTANALPEQTHWESAPGDDSLAKRVHARGLHPWKLQVEPNSPLGAWIAGLTGTQNIGQHRGHFPLGVLCDAVQRHLAALGLTHLLLGPSRRDPPSRPWHTGAFLRRDGQSFDFHWHGHALLGDDPVPVRANCVVRMAAQIVGVI